MPSGFGRMPVAAVPATDVLTVLLAVTVTTPPFGGVFGARYRPVGETVPAVADQVTPPGRLATVARSWTLAPATRRSGMPEMATDGVAPAIVAVDTGGLSGKVDAVE